MKISVIVPVYNSESYIDRCIKSIINQKYSDWELLVVDDGSTDNSLQILKKYEKIDTRINVYAQKNKGPGSARNLGLRYATGEYVVFVDSDDYIEDNYFELLSKKNDDVVFIDINQVNEEYSIIRTEYMSKYNKIPKNEFVRKQITGMIPWGGVRKAVKKKVLDKYNIKFSNLQIGEEAIYSFKILYFSNTFSFIDVPVYSYVYRQNSQSKKKMDDPWGMVANNLKKELMQLKIYNEFENTINAFFYVSAIISIYNLAHNYNYAEYRKKFFKIIKCYNELLIKNKNNKIDFNNIKKIYKLMYPLFKIKAALLFYVISYLKRR